ncbi:unnamed protein product [Microthlaspi erraticum]|uniref:Uncharacterized protein n=1 Tax=Microthlaspi erraticum TaxID=1685480 RepID=A0A6D2JFM5_9BRAS|nr:unnamed protein product [Microthlaspi erraticum]
MAQQEDQSAVRLTGKVSWFNDSKGYGFITPDNNGEDIFVHQVSILSEGFRSLTTGDAVEFEIKTGNDGKFKADEVTAPGGAPLKKKEVSSRGNGARRDGCYNCGVAGHMAKDCVEERVERGSGGTVCFTCNEPGHIARDCDRKPSGNVESRGERRGAGGKGCYNCGDHGHIARDCNQKSGGERRGAGGGGECYTCGGVGHRARDCPTERQPKACYECGGFDHLSRDCERRGSGGNAGGGSRACFNCNKEGHFARDCPVA